MTPWYHRLRIAEDIAMLTLLSEGPLRIGLGRGMAPLEYETFGISLFEAKDRFEEIREIVRIALTGKPFTYYGTQGRLFYELRLEDRIPENHLLRRYRGSFLTFRERCPLLPVGSSSGRVRNGSGVWKSSTSMS